VTNASYTVTVKRIIRDDQNGLLLSWYILRGLAICAGILEILFALVSFISIIFIPMAAFFINGAKDSFRFARGERGVKCPNCSKKNMVKAGQQQTFNCRKCKEHVEIEWVDLRPKKDTADEKPSA
jgi:DNA-directed RNA polymerase subunit RPC12/RpoP